MLKFNRVIENPSRRLSQVLLAALFGALLLAMFVNTASAQSSAAIGRMFTGEVQSVSTVNGLLAIESKGTLFQLAISSNTVINVPPDKDVGMAGLPSQLGFRIAGLATEAITDDNGIPHAEVRTALKIMVIPGKATRSHKRTIASDKDGDSLTTLDEDGKKRNLASLGAGIEKGEAVIVLVQKPGRDATEETVRGLIRAKTVTDRLERFTKAEADDPIKQSVIAGLRDKLSDAQEKRLQKTSENAEAGLREFVLSRVKAMQKDRQAEVKQRGVGADVSECARTIVGTRATSIKDLTSDQRQRVTDECLKPKPEVTPTPTPVVITSPVVRITSPTSGTVVGAKDVVTVTAEAKDDIGVTSLTFNVAGVDQAPQTETPYTIDVTVPLGVTTLAIKATAVDADGNTGSDSIVLRVERRSGDLGIKITSPTATLDSATTIRPSTVSGSTGAIVQGDTIAIIAEVTGTGVVTVVFNIAGVDQTPDSEPPYAMRYFVPFTSDAAPAPLVITATATDAAGDSISDTATVQIIRKVTDVNVKITSPVPSDKLTAGATIVIRAETGNDADIAFVTFSVGGVDTVRTVAPFTHTYVLPGRKTTKAATSSIPPNVFVGKVTLEGKSARRGTKVTAWIAGMDSTTLTIKVTATANSSETDIATVLVPVSGAVNAGETTVAEGEYVLNAAQPSGQSFTGKTVTFTIGDKDAKETGIWKQGGATILDLTAD
jgi:hypothetical protein